MPRTDIYMKQTFNKAERLTNKKIIDRLFKRGSTEIQTFYLFPFRIVYLHNQPAADEPTEAAVSLPSILISVSKRSFKHAVDRNQVRRRVREAYRLNKTLLFGAELPTHPPYIAFLYTAKQIISFEEIEKGMKLALRKLGGDQSVKSRA